MELIWFSNSFFTKFNCSFSYSFLRYISRSIDDVRKRLILKSFNNIILAVDEKDSFLTKEGTILLKSFKENKSIKIFLIIIQQSFNF